ncbi:hypothetical protein RHSIM_RhsimUnG0160700 [Rhododendron simsii]|uniref:Uncharacterized protein n=1 Tax=Rhododendron simsii TaxID=118357 RepID=A0A834FV25_RHOSS|nr:hypothetical protein RHSIM_RhsimUnG0160700 [Rhododendron simsii]
MHKQRRYLELVDPRLEGQVTSEEDVEKLVRVALCCVHQNPALRPSMANVVGMFEGGYPIMLGNPISTVAFAVVWNLFARQRPYEEYFLRQFFGSEYDEYAHRLPSGVPFVK